MRRLVWLTLIGLAVPARAAEEGAVQSLQAVVEVERGMLDEARVRWDALSRRYAALAEELAPARAALESAVRERETPDPRRVGQLAEQLERIEAERATLIAAERLVVERVAQHLQRIEMLEQQLAARQAQQEPGQGALTGTWELALMPTDHRGTARLVQSGALVSGTYELEGGWSGSLQGTLVNRKVFLVRIDSKLGKSMELEGYLSTDGGRIRGSWLSYELAGSDGATGQWTALRRTETP